MAARPAAASRAQPEPDINITPLVDVVLVVLIIFMVVTPQMENGVSVDLPSVSQPDKNPKSKLDPIRVTVTRSLSHYLDKEAVPSRDALMTRLEGLRRAEPERRIILQADAAVRYDEMRDLFARCQRLGFAGSSLSVSQRGGAAATGG